MLKRNEKKMLKTFLTAYLRIGKSFSSCIAISHSFSEGASQFITPCCKRHFTQFIFLLEAPFSTISLEVVKLYYVSIQVSVKYLCVLCTYIHPTCFLSNMSRALLVEDISTKS